jgi:hypothetical protein
LTELGKLRRSSCKRDLSPPPCGEGLGWGASARTPPCLSLTLKASLPTRGRENDSFTDKQLCRIPSEVPCWSFHQGDETDIHQLFGLDVFGSFLNPQEFLPVLAAFDRYDHDATTGKLIE